MSDLRTNSSLLSLPTRRSFLKSAGAVMAGARPRLGTHRPRLSFESDHFGCHRVGHDGTKQYQGILAAE